MVQETKTIEKKAKKHNFDLFKSYKIEKVNVPYVVKQYKAFGLDHVMNQSNLYCALLSQHVKNGKAFVHMATYIQIAEGLYDIATSKEMTEKDLLKTYSNRENAITLGEIVNTLVMYDTYDVSTVSSI